MRVAKVIALLLTLGAVSGGVMGLLVLLGITTIEPVSVADIPQRNVYGLAAAFGALVGALTGPPLAFIFLRRVPLWRATIETAGAAGLGAAAGMALPNVPFGWAYAGFVFAVLAALRLNRAYKRREAKPG